MPITKAGKTEARAKEVHERAFKAYNELDYSEAAKLFEEASGIYMEAYDQWAKLGMLFFRWYLISIVTIVIILMAIAIIF